MDTFIGIVVMCVLAALLFCIVTMTPRGPHR